MFNRLSFENGGCRIRFRTNPFAASSKQRRQKVVSYQSASRRFSFRPLSTFKAKEKERRRQSSGEGLTLVARVHVFKDQGRSVGEHDGRIFQVKRSRPALHVSWAYKVGRKLSHFTRSFYLSATPKRIGVSKDCSGVRAFGGGRRRRSVRYSRIARFANGPERLQRRSARCSLACLPEDVFR